MPERARSALITLLVALAAMGLAVLIKGLILGYTHANAGFILYVPAVAVVDRKSVV